MNAKVLQFPKIKKRANSGAPNSVARNIVQFPKRERSLTEILRAEHSYF